MALLDHCTPKTMIKHMWPCTPRQLKFLAALACIFTLVYILNCYDLKFAKMSSPSEIVHFHDLRVSLGTEIVLQLYGIHEKELLVGSIGQTIEDPEDYYNLVKTDSSVSLEFPSGVQLTVQHNGTQGTGEPSCYNILWECTESRYQKLQDMFSLKGAHWYGGSVVLSPLWPMERQQRSPEPFITGDSYNDRYGGVQERFWLSSNGTSIFVDYNVPLFVGINESEDMMLNFISAFEKPYGNSKNRRLFLNYTICKAENVTAMYLGAAGKFWKKPFDTPDKRVFRYPIWSTWAMYKAYINQSKVIDLAMKINQQGFKNSHLEIDDGWAERYGDFNFDLSKFPEPLQMVRTLKNKLGFRVTLWVHPFASPFSNAIWRRDSSGNRIWIKLSRVNIPAFVIWWNGVGALLDLSNPEATSWYLGELQNLIKMYEVDSFKFDAGECTWLSSWGITVSPMDNLNDYTKAFANVAYKSDPDRRIQEIRASVSSQHLPVFVRILDKDSHWRYDNGLRSIIPHVLLFGVIGYPFILPDMIGGNAYGFIFIHSTTWPERELYIRWMELTALLPAMQFSVVPWQYDDEVLRIAHKMCNLHEKYANKIVGLAEDAVRTGAPIIRPLWWIAPFDKEALTIDTEFLVGNDLLVAPIVDQGATSRDIYLPDGKWKDKLRGGVLQGGRWYRNYQVLLDELAYFTAVR